MGEKYTKRIAVMAAFVFSSLVANAEVRIADVFSTNMVLQRNSDIKVWGKADPREKVWVYFNGQKQITRTDKNGKWSVMLKPMKAVSEPLEMKIIGKNEIVLKNILIGDVWVCSGQSNMQMKVSETSNAQKEISNANFSEIRLFTVPTTVSTTPLETVSNASWEICSPETVKYFSAVGYYFGRDVYKEINVPIGLIHSSWGGTCVETWTSKASITKLPNYENMGERIDNYDPEKLKAQKKESLAKAIGSFPEKERGMNEKWMIADTDRSDWKTMDLPTLWGDAGYKHLNGVVWYSLDVHLDSTDLKNDAFLHLGKIDDSDITWVNGKKVGEMKWGYDVERLYTVPKNLLKIGKNNISIRVESPGYEGGFGSKSDRMFLQLKNQNIALSGSWKYKIDKVLVKFKEAPNDVPSLLYNGMIHPIIPYGIKGVIWYQGESNTPRSKEYEITFPNMIQNWREDWQQGDFPFLFVQLANFMRPSTNPQDDNWAELRETQTKSLSVKKTGMAVAIDIGDASNIHPLNKQDVGNRLMLSALKVAYGKDIVHSGPIYKSMKIEENKAIISFDYIGSGLLTKSKHGYVNEFEMAGADKKFYWAKAKLEGDKIVLWSDNVKNPVAVRFAWSANPAELNLYNKEGLPASPFRTDDWEGITDGKSFDD